MTVVHARRTFNPTGLVVRPGERYALRADGAWWDAFVRASPDGYDTASAPAVSRWLLRRFEARRRIPAEPWFALCGSVGEGGRPFRIGRALDWTVPDGASGELLVWANDVPFAYWNNFGSVDLTAARLP